jgi:Uma2 family endonuclease
MSVALLETPPLVPPAGLGPYRRDDYEALPDEPRCELIFGRFQVSPSPSLIHQFIVSFLLHEFFEIASENGGLALVAPMDVYLAEHSVVQPDLLYIGRQRRSIAQERIEGAPDLLVEVLSPGSGRRDRDEKMRLYAETGVGEYWIIDPAERQIEFLINAGDRFMVQGLQGSVYQSPRLPEVRLNVEALWTTVEQRFPGEHPSS